MSDDEEDGWETDVSGHIVEPPLTDERPTPINPPTYVVKINKYNNMEFFLTPNQTILAKQGLQTAINKLELTGTEWAVPRKVTGSTFLTENSETTYNKHYKGLFFFLQWIGDFER